MESGYYAAFAGLAARMEALDLVANNLANVSTTGYRGQHEFYRALTANLGDRALSPLNAAINDFGVLGGATIDLRQGNLQSTGNSLDLAVSGPGFFVVQTKNGIRYTRNGAFHVNKKGQMVTEQEDQVLGANGPIQIPEGEVNVSQDGTISVNSQVAGQVKLAEFAPGTNLVPEGDSNFIVPSGSEKPAVESKINGGMLESSNLNPVQESVALMVLQRHSEMLSRTLSVFLNDFDRTAVQDLSRV